MRLKYLSTRNRSFCLPSHITQGELSLLGSLSQRDVVLYNGVEVLDLDLLATEQAFL